LPLQAVRGQQTRGIAVRSPNRKATLDVTSTSSLARRAQTDESRAVSRRARSDQHSHEQQAMRRERPEEQAVSSMTSAATAVEQAATDVPDAGTSSGIQA
jgi:hypothetical protein